MGALASRFVDSGNEWATPWPIVQDAMLQLGIQQFDLDPAATAENAKAPKFYTREHDGTVMPWFGMVWLNSPFSKHEDPCLPDCERKTCAKRGFHHPNEIIHGAVDFARKAVHELQAKRVEAVAWHGPVATDTGWYAHLWPWVHHRTDYNARVCYNEADGGGTFPSQTLILRPYRRTTTAVPTILRPTDGGSNL